MPFPRLLSLFSLLTALLAACSPAAGEPTPDATTTLRPYVTATTTATATHVLPQEGGTPDELLPTATPFVHRVQEGETLLDVALEYGISLDELLAANPGIDPRFLSIDQELRIPGPDGTASDTLLPTSTPLPLTTEDVICQRAPSEVFFCIVTVANPTDIAVEGLTARINLLDAAGGTIASNLAHAPLNLLPAGAKMPLAAQFAADTQTPAGANAIMISAVQAADIDERYLAVEVEEQEAVPAEQGRRWRVRARITLEADVPESGMRLSLLATGIDAAGRIVGFTKWEPEPGQQAPFEADLMVQSLQGAIERIELLVEAAPLPE